MDLLYIKTKNPLVIESFVFDTIKDAMSFYTKNPHKHMYIGFFDQEKNKLTTLAENESEVDKYEIFFKHVVNENTEVNHIFEDSSFES